MATFRANKSSKRSENPKVHCN